MGESREGREKYLAGRRCKFHDGDNPLELNLVLAYLGELPGDGRWAGESLGLEGWLGGGREG